MYAVKRQNTTIHTLPHLLVVHVPALDRGPQLVDIFGIRDRDLQIRTLLIALEAEQVLPHRHLDRVYYRLVLRQLSFQVGFEAVDVCLYKVDWGRDIEVMEEVGDMEKYRVTGLSSSDISRVFAAEGSGPTSVTPNNLTVVLPPCNVPSSASIC